MGKYSLSVILGALLAFSGCASVSQNTTPESPWQENAVIAKINSLPTDISVYKMERDPMDPRKITAIKGKITNFTIELLTNSGRTLKYQYRDLEIKYLAGERVVIIYSSEESQRNGRIWYLRRAR